MKKIPRKFKKLINKKFKNGYCCFYYKNALHYVYNNKIYLLNKIYFTGTFRKVCLKGKFFNHVRI